MKKKLSLDMDALAVESFDTAARTEEPRGTVHGREDEAAAAPPACTCRNTDLCETAYYHCGTGPHTIHSCDYSVNRSCVYGAE